MPPLSAALDGEERLGYYQALLTKPDPRFPVCDLDALGLVLHFAHTYDVLYTDLARRMALHGLSISAFNLLTILARSESGNCPLHEIGDLLLVSRANVTGLVDSLVRKGLVERQVDPLDRRVRLARITTRGERLLIKVLPEHYRRLSEICSGLCPRDKEELHTLLRKLRSPLKEEPQ